MKAHIKEVYTYYGLIRNLLIFEFMQDLLFRTRAMPSGVAFAL
nr:MAG TPA: hypothetical protein [Caudoviricetes sp.]